MTGPASAANLPPPIDDRWFEDYVPGSMYEFGHATLSEAEIVAFAGHYDPQPIHTDPASGTGPFGGLIASGVHTIGACMRLYVDHYISHTASSPGLDDVRWPHPVRLSDRLRIRVTVPRGVRHAPSLTGDSCIQPSRHSTKTTTSCCRSSR